MKLLKENQMIQYHGDAMNLNIQRELKSTKLIVMSSKKPTENKKENQVIKKYIKVL